MFVSFYHYLAVAAGSIAAAVRSAVYGGANTGIFSVLQSVGFLSFDLKT